MIDLRSDTKTQPSAEMRAAIAAAEVGDEQRREDRTVNALEPRVAALLGQEEAVFVPTATMANEIALRTLGRPGRRGGGRGECAPFISELGGPAVHAGLMTRQLRCPNGRFTPDQLRETCGPGDRTHTPRTESSPSRTPTTPPGAASGRSRRSTRSRDRTRAPPSHAPRRREVMNAAVASGVPAARIAGQFDTATLCLSKGLGCPLGALIAGSAELMAEARRLKHSRRCDATGGDRRGGGGLRARPQRRAARGGSRSSAAPRGGTRCGRLAIDLGTSGDQLRPGRRPTARALDGRGAQAALATGHRPLEDGRMQLAFAP